MDVCLKSCIQTEMISGLLNPECLENEE